MPATVRRLPSTLMSFATESAIGLGRAGYTN
jgi:hypothetical protein